jgi:hypothetical protein
MNNLIEKDHPNGIANEMVDLMNEDKLKNEKKERAEKEQVEDNDELSNEKSKYIELMTKEILYNSLAQAAMRVCYQKMQFKFKRLFLIISIAVLLSLASYTLIQSIRGYFNYEVITTSRTIYETPTLFPKITICNQNMLQTEYGWEFISNINSSWNFFKYPNLMKNLTYTEQYTVKTKFYAIAQSKLLEENFTDDKLRRLGHNFEDLLINCYFKNNPCSHKDFTWTFDPFYGNCYEFNADGNHKISIPGWDNGLKLEFYVNFNEKLNRINSVYGGVGALIRIENSSYFVDHGWEGIRLPGGYQSDIAIERKFKFIMPKPYSNCEIDGDTSVDTIEFNSDLFDIIRHSR